MLAPALLFLRTVNSWDLIVTSRGINILVLPVGPHARSVLAFQDGLVVITEDESFVLKDSAQAAGFCSQKKHVLVVEVEETAQAERIIPVVVHDEPMTAKGLKHGAK